MSRSARQAATERASRQDSSMVPSSSTARRRDVFPRSDKGDATHARSSLSGPSGRGPAASRVPTRVGDASLIVVDEKRTHAFASCRRHGFPPRTAAEGVDFAGTGHTLAAPRRERVRSSANNRKRREPSARRRPEALVRMRGLHSSALAHIVNNATRTDARASCTPSWRESLVDNIHVLDDTSARLCCPLAVCMHLGPSENIRSFALHRAPKRSARCCATSVYALNPKTSSRGLAAGPGTCSTHDRSPRECRAAASAFGSRRRAASAVDADIPTETRRQRLEVRAAVPRCRREAHARTVVARRKYDRRNHFLLPEKRSRAVCSTLGASSDSRETPSFGQSEVLAGHISLLSPFSKSL